MLHRKPCQQFVCLALEQCIESTCNCCQLFEAQIFNLFCGLYVPLQFREVGDQVLMHVNPSLPGIPAAITKYTEYYNKDQSPNSWAMRRDIRVGKTVGQMYMTTDGMLILR